MYIKIKHIKKILLVSACVFFAGFNYLTYVKADSTKSGAPKSCDKSIDTDCDGLTDTEEKLYETDANNADSDGDGYSDGVEVKSGYDPTKPAPGDKITNSISSSATSPNSSSLQDANYSLTDDFTQEFQTFIASKGTTPISNTDVSDFVTEKIADKTGSQITIDSLPEVDASSVRILNQTYPLMSSDERKKQITEDSSRYFTTLIYLIISNSPRMIATREDLAAFNTDFIEHVSTLASTNPDNFYFSDLGDRLDSLLNQLSDIEVPETIAPMHIKMIRITKGFLSLRGIPNTDNDPISKMALLSKIQTLSQISTDFLSNDVANYFNQF